LFGGPVNEYTIVNDSNSLSKLFGKPTDNNYIDWFCASNFLSYSDNLKIVRVVDSKTALNSTIDGTGLKVDNLTQYQSLIAANVGESEIFVARYPGVMGDSLKISIADNATFDSWKYKDLFDFLPPGTSQYAENLGAVNDEIHIVVIDEKGKFTGIPGSVLEKYPFLSKAQDNKDLDNEPNFYGIVLNNTSKYIWYFSPIKSILDLDISNYVDSVTVTNSGQNYGKPIITFSDDNIAVGDSPGIGAKATAKLNSNGGITSIEILNKGSGYSDTVGITITDSGENATAQATVVSGVITAISPVNVGSNYYSSNVTIVDGGEGATATAVLSTTGSIKIITINQAGVDYTIGDELTINSGNSDATFIVDSVDLNGEILTGHLDVVGSGYSDGTNLSSTSNPLVGTGATFDIVINKTIENVIIDETGSDYGTAIITLTGGNPTSEGSLIAVIGTGIQSNQIIDITINDGGTGYETVPTITITPGGSGALATAVLGVKGTPQEGQILSYVVTNGGINYGNPQIIITPGGSGALATANLVEDTSETNWGMTNANEYGIPRTFHSLKNVSDGSYSKELSGGNDGNKASTSDIIAGWDMFKNAEEVDVNLLFIGDGGGSVSNKTVIRHIIDNICEFRKDCILFFSPNLKDILNKDQTTSTQNVREFITHPINGINRNTSFAVADNGWKMQYDVFSNKYRWIPLNPDIAGLCAQTETDYDAWWSPAGLNRGRIKNVQTLAFNPNKQSRDGLYKANINSVVSFTGEGVFLYGDRTLLRKNSAFSNINVRRLFIALEKSISRSAKANLFEFNDDFTRSQFVGMVEPYLRSVKARRGIQDFKVICDTSNNTPDVIDRSEFVASIFVKPSRSINFITLNFVAVRTGVEFSEVVGAV